MAEPSEAAEVADPSAAEEVYPWYGVVHDASLRQGDFFFRLPAYVPQYAEELAQVLDRDVPEDLEGEPIDVDVFLGRYDVVVLSQSCDLLNRKNLPLSVLVCPIFDLEGAKQHIKSLADKNVLDEARQGKMPGVHMLAACEVPEFSRGIQLALFHQIFTNPFSYVKSVAEAQQTRLRLLPPYREHLAQAFARFVMRVGLPQDIPKLK
jgi:hypothetical protein